jgi:V/A-type H+-transporting ATPase subunit I
MIMRMKRLTLLLYHRHRDDFLTALQELGAVHIVESPDKDAAGLQPTETMVKRSQHFLRAMRSRAAQATASPRPQTRADALAVIERFEKLESEKTEAELELQRCITDESALAPWGELDPTHLKALAAHGVFMRFFKMRRKAFAKLDEQEPLRIVAVEDSDSVYFTAFSRDPEPAELDAEELHLPARTLTQIRAAAREIGMRLDRIRNALTALAAEVDTVNTFSLEQQNRNRFIAANLDFSAQAGGRLLYLQAYVPAARQKQLEALLDRFSVWFQLEDPVPGEDVPVQLQNGPFTRLFEPIQKLYMLPSYWELDPTPFFAPFFAFFVGLCLGDVGYGTIILIAGLIARRKVSDSLSPMATMITVLAVMVIFCGFLLNSFFGMTLFGGPGIPAGTALLHTSVPFLSPPPLAPVETSRGTSFPAMSFAVLIALFQLTFAMILQGVNKYRQTGWLGSLSAASMIFLLWGAIICMTHTNFMDLNIQNFAVGSWRIGQVFQAVPFTVGKFLLFAGAGLFMLFGHESDGIVARFGWRLFDFYNFLTGMLGNVLSYIRLFALGLTSGLLGATFNGLALGFITRDGVVHWGSPLIVLTVLLLLVGHALNFLLSLVGAFVHPVRLTFVEFFGTLQFGGGGKPYVPFEKAKPE